MIHMGTCAKYPLVFWVICLLFVSASGYFFSWSTDQTPYGLLFPLLLLGGPIVIVSFFVWGVSGRPAFFYLSAFLIPLPTLGFQAGVYVSWLRLLFPASLLIMMSKKADIRPGQYGLKQLTAFLSYAVAITLFAMLIDGIFRGAYEVGSDLGWGAAQSMFRYWVQIGTLFTVWGVIIIPIFLLRNVYDFKALINGYIAGNLFSTFLGFYQIIALRRGLPWIDSFFIGQERQITADRVTQKALDIVYFRLSGLGGEPKHYSSFAMCALIVMLSYLFWPTKVELVRSTRLKIGVLLLGIVLSGSTSAWLALIIVFMFFFTISIPSQPGKLVGFVFVIFVVIVVLLQYTGDLLPSIFKARFTDRLVLFSNSEPKDAAVLEYLSEHPGRIFFGRGAGGLDFELVRYVPPEYFRWQQMTGTVTPTYFFTRTLGEFGLFGFLLIAMIWRKWYITVKKTPDLQWGKIFLIASVVALLITASISLTAYLFIGAAIVVAANQRHILTEG